MSAMRSGVRRCLLLAGLLVSFASADDIGYWRLGGIVVNLANGVVLPDYFRWHDYHRPAVPESLLSMLRRTHANGLKLDTALFAVRYPDTSVIVTTAQPVQIPLDGVGSITAAAGPLDGRGSYNTPPVTRHQADLLQTKPYAMLWGTLESGASVSWLSYDTLVGLDELRTLDRLSLAGYLEVVPGTNLIRLTFYHD